MINLSSNNSDDYYGILVEFFMKNKDFMPGIVNLCEHYFYLRQFDKAQKLAILGLNRVDRLIKVSHKEGSVLKNDMLEIKSKFFYILGFIEQTKIQKNDSNSEE